MLKIQEIFDRYQESSLQVRVPFRDLRIEKTALEKPNMHFVLSEVKTSLKLFYFY